MQSSKETSDARRFHLNTWLASMLTCWIADQLKHNDNLPGEGHLAVFCCKDIHSSSNFETLVFQFSCIGLTTCCFSDYMNFEEQNQMHHQPARRHIEVCLSLSVTQKWVYAQWKPTSSVFIISNSCSSLGRTPFALVSSFSLLSSSVCCISIDIACDAELSFSARAAWSCSSSSLSCVSLCSISCAYCKQNNHRKREISKQELIQEYNLFDVKSHSTEKIQKQWSRQIKRKNPAVMQSVLVFEGTCRCYMCSHKDLEIEKRCNKTCKLPSRWRASWAFWRICSCLAVNALAYAAFSACNEVSRNCNCQRMMHNKRPLPINLCILQEWRNLYRPVRGWQSVHVSREPERNGPPPSQHVDEADVLQYAREASVAWFAADCAAKPLRGHLTH